MMGKNYNKAKELIRQLGVIAPQVFSGDFDVAKWHESQEAYDEFLSEFRYKVRDKEKASVADRVVLGYVAWTEGDRQKALEQIRKAAAEVPHESAWVNIIDALESPGGAKPKQPEPKQAERAAGSLPAL